MGAHSVASSERCAVRRTMRPGRAHKTAWNATTRTARAFPPPWAACAGGRRASGERSRWVGPSRSKEGSWPPASRRWICHVHSSTALRTDHASSRPAPLVSSPPGSQVSGGAVQARAGPRPDAHALRGPGAWRSGRAPSDKRRVAPRRSARSICYLVANTQRWLPCGSASTCHRTSSSGGRSTLAPRVTRAGRSPLSMSRCARFLVVVRCGTRQARTCAGSATSRQRPCTRRSAQRLPQGIA